MPQCMVYEGDTTMNISGHTIMQIVKAKCVHAGGVCMSPVHNKVSLPLKKGKYESETYITGIITDTGTQECLQI